MSWSFQREDKLVTTTSPTSRSLSAPASPMGVGWLPDGFTEPRLSLTAKGRWTFDSTLGKQQASISVQISTTAFTKRTGKGSLTQTTINGDDATLYKIPQHKDGEAPYGNTFAQSQGPFIELDYQRSSGLWIRVEAFNALGNGDLEVTDADVEKVAAELTDEEVPVPELLRFDSIPANVTFGGVWSGWSGAYTEVQLVSESAPPRSTNLEGGGHSPDLVHSPFVIVATEKGNALARVGAGRVLRTIRLSGHPAVTIYKPALPERRTIAVVPIGKGQAIAVSAASSLGWTNDKLARFVLGIRTGADYRCCGY